jgi:hypothetical protein
MSTRRTAIPARTCGSKAVNLREIVEKYLAIAGGYGRPAVLADFGLDRNQTERVFSAFDEDYHISRYFHFTRSTGTRYTINGFDHTHVSIDADIQNVL